MKVTEENLDGMDCRPPTGKVNWDLVPEHMRESLVRREAAPTSRKPAGAITEDQKHQLKSDGGPRMNG